MPRFALSRLRRHTEIACAVCAAGVTATVFVPWHSDVVLVLPWHRGERVMSAAQTQAAVMQVHRMLEAQSIARIAIELALLVVGLAAALLLSARILFPAWRQLSSGHSVVVFPTVALTLSLAAAIGLPRIAPNVPSSLTLASVPSVVPWVAVALSASWLVGALLGAERRITGWSVSATGSRPMSLVTVGSS